MTGDPNGSAGQSRLEQQADDLLDDHTEAVELVGSLDFGYVESNDEYADWHASTDLKPMVRALFLKELEGYSFSELHRFLSDDEEAADALGFDDLPSRTTFGRAWRDRFDDDLKHYLRRNAEKLRTLARERGNGIGLHAIEPDDKADASKRTQDRYIARKTEEVTEEMQRLVFPAFDFDRADNAHYDTDAFLELQSHMGLSGSAAESGTDLFDADTDRPEGAPDGDTHLYNLKRWDQGRVRTMLDDAIGRMVGEAKRHLQFNRPAEVAIDMTYVAYYGDRDGLEMIQGTPPSKAYEWCYKFATLTVVGENVKLTLAVRPVQKGDLVGEVVRDLLADAREHVSISMVYADSEFCAVDAIHALDDAGVGYVIPSPKNKRVKREIGRMTEEIAVKRDYAIYGTTRARSNDRAETNLVLVPSTQDETKTVAFVTNKDVTDETMADRFEAEGWVNRYGRRWGIENSYKTIKDFLAWTTSKDFTVRLFYFGFAVLLYNMWLLVDLLVQLALDCEHRYKPRVTAKRFLNLARKHLGTG